MSECAGEDCTHEDHGVRREQRQDYPRIEHMRGHPAALQAMLEGTQALATAHLFHKRYITPGAGYVPAPDAACAPVLGVHRPWCTCV